MSVTTVKIQESTKAVLDTFRNAHESYDAAIRKVLSLVKQRNLRRQLIEGYQNIGKEELDILEEWEPASFNG